MSDILFPLLDDSVAENKKLFIIFRNKLFSEYSKNNKHIFKQDLKDPLSEITKELFNTKLDAEGFEIIFNDLDEFDKGYITKKQFNIVAKCLVMSLVTYFQKKYPVPGREINLCMIDRELPEQIEIIDTMTDSEINDYKKKRVIKHKSKDTNKYFQRHKLAKELPKSNKKIINISDLFIQPDYFDD